jgi:hypothetical protein
MWQQTNLDILCNYLKLYAKLLDKSSTAFEKLVVEKLRMLTGMVPG